jgi:lipopolysaccharide/colanic/teichoic acid biosynthesis glycosyltransferase
MPRGRHHRPRCGGYRGKRALDLALLALLAVPALLCGLLCAIAILCEDGGPVLFRQARVGLGGRTFSLLKLRTMRVATGGHSAFPEYDRITRVGALLRRLSLDELPQLLHVARGEMSLVGPRPALPYQVSRYDSRQRLRLSVPPGLTGLAQVRGRNRIGWPERIELDLRYVHAQSFRRDVAILARSVKVVLKGDGVAGHPRQDPIAGERGWS